MDRFYSLLDVPVSATSREVVKAAAQALHPWLRHDRGLRISRRRFYREMLNQHDLARERARTLSG